MKFLAAFAVFIIAISAQAPVPNRNIITDQVIEAIEDVIEGIRDLGLDPLHIPRESVSYALPVPVIFNAAASLEELWSTGLSDIIITHIHYDILGFRLTFVIEMPRIHFSADLLHAEVVVFDNLLYADASGSIDVHDTIVRGEVRVGLLSGIGVRAVDIDFKLGTIDSKAQLSILSWDLSAFVNRFIGEVVPNRMTSFKAEVDELIEIILLDYINENLFI